MPGIFTTIGAPFAVVNGTPRELLNGLPREYIEDPPRGFLKANPGRIQGQTLGQKPEGPQAPRGLGA